MSEQLVEDFWTDEVCQDYLELFIQAAGDYVAQGGTAIDFMLANRDSIPLAVVNYAKSTYPETNLLDNLGENLADTIS